MVEPVDPFQRGVLDGFEAASGSAPVDHLGFVETVDRFGQSVVVAVADTADRWLDAGLGKALGVLDRHVLGGFNRSSQRFENGGERWIPESDDRTGAHDHNCGRRGGPRSPIGMSVQCSGSMLLPG